MANDKNQVIFDDNGATLSMLADLTGKTRRTITKRMRGMNAIGKKKGASTYDIQEALKRIYKEDYAPKEEQAYKPVTPNDFKAHFEAEEKANALASFIQGDDKDITTLPNTNRAAANDRTNAYAYNKSA